MRCKAVQAMIHGGRFAGSRDTAEPARGTVALRPAEAGAHLAGDRKDPMMQTPRLDMRGHLLCAVCGDDYTHLRAVHSYQGDDVTRQDVTLTFECENGGHYFDVTFHQHKGNTEVSAEARTPKVSA